MVWLGVSVFLTDAAQEHLCVFHIISKSHLYWKCQLVVYVYQQKGNRSDK